MNNIFFKGFTLAEVLITLAIIGIVAAMTIPSIMQKNTEKRTVVKLKKVYAIWSNAYKLAMAEHGTPDNWFSKPADWGSESGDVLVGVMKDYVKFDKICSKSTGCLKDVKYKHIDNHVGENWNRVVIVSKFKTADGMSGYIYGYSSTPSVAHGTGEYTTAYGALTLDINGFNGPNCFGKDTFSFIFTEQGLFPAGSPSASETVQFPNDCNITKCAGMCEVCTAWVIKNENMDYLHCTGLSWDGKHSCSEK